MPKIHPTAVVHPEAELADDVEVGPFCVIESGVRIGAGTVLREGVVVRRHTTMGSGNLVDAYTVLGGEPQDLKFDPKIVSHLRIGDRNVFREGVTISRATGEGKVTTVGSNTYWMAQAHAGHNATIEDGTILSNGTAVGGHATLHRRAILSGNVMVHQFCWIGEMVMSQGNAGASTHVPPYCLFANINRLIGLNVVGLRRAQDITEEDRRQIKEAFRLTYRCGMGPVKALEKMDACTDWGVAAGKFRDFIRRVVTAEKPFHRGLCPLRIIRGSTFD
jgi:UDP-N-acetylglucosamine acyltransferase